MKFTLDRAVTEGAPESFASKDQAQANPLAAKLFELPGVASVFFLNNFVTITRDPSQSWDQLVPEVVNVIQEHYQGQS
ncbi:MAG: NifU N-terminal domain-containing protein [Limnochordales bacterium]